MVFTSTTKHQNFKSYSTANQPNDTACVCWKVSNRFAERRNMYDSKSNQLRPIIGGPAT